MFRWIKRLMLIFILLWFSYTLGLIVGTDSGVPALGFLVGILMPALVIYWKRRPLAGSFHAFGRRIALALSKDNESPWKW